MLKTINILLSSDEKFLIHVFPLIKSLRSNTDKKLRIFFVYSSISDDKINDLKLKINCLGNINFTEILLKDDFLNGIPITNSSGDKYFGKEAFYRIFSPFYLPKSIDKVLYLDVDIICNNSFDDFYSLNLKDNFYIGCRDLGIGRKHCESLGISNVNEYINTGVLLINLKEIRKKLSKKDLIKKLFDMKDLIEYADQDFTNKCFNKKIKIVDNKYNYLVSHYKKIGINKRKSVFIHYAGGLKPWLNNNHHINFYLTSRYFKYSNLSFFFKIKSFLKRTVFVILSLLKK